MVMICFNMFFFEPASWSNGNTFVSGAGGLRFKSQYDQIQRWSPKGRPWLRGHVFKSLVLALASKLRCPQNCPVLGSRVALFFDWLKKNKKQTNKRQHI